MKKATLFRSALILSQVGVMALVGSIAYSKGHVNGYDSGFDTGRKLGDIEGHMRGVCECYNIVSDVVKKAEHENDFDDSN